MIGFLIRLIPFPGLRRRLRCRYKTRGKPAGYFFGGAVPLDFGRANGRRPVCLVVAPHPDDELIGLGGLMCMFPDCFDVVCLASAGRDAHGMKAEEMSRRRIGDFGRIMSRLGIRRGFIFEYHGGDMCGGFYRKNMAGYMHAVDLNDYDYIFLPHPHDAHPDHMLVLPLVRAMAKKQGARSLTLVFYEVWSPMPDPNSWVDVEGALDRKSRLIRMYSIGGGYAGPMEGLARYRAMSLTGFSRRYVEAFRVEKIKP
jgi:LmbE family N-acetylglucosaminyl deacetylase